MAGNPNDMKSSFGIEDDGSTKTTIKEIAKFDDALLSADESAKQLTSTFEDMDKAADDMAKNVSQSFADLPLSIPQDIPLSSQSNAGGGAGGGGSGVGGVGRAASRFGASASALTGGGLGEVGEVLKMGQAVEGLTSSAKVGKDAVMGLVEGIGLSGGTGAALVAVAVVAAVAINELSSAMDEQTDAAKEQLSSIQNTAEAIATGDREMAAAQAERLKRDKEILQFQIDQSEKEEAAAESTEQVVEDFLGFFKTKPSEVFRDAQVDLQDKIDQIDSDLGVLGESFAGGLEGLLTSAEQTTDSIAQAARQQVEFAQQAEKLTVEGAEGRLDAIKEQQTAIQAEIDARKTSGDTTEDNVDAIKALESQLSSLGNESEMVASQLSSGAAALRDMTVEGERMFDELGRSQEQSAERSAAAIEKYSDALKDNAAAADDAGIAAERNSKKAEKKLEESFAKSQIKDIKTGQDDILKITADFNKEIKQGELELKRDIRDLNRAAGDDALDALDDRNVLELLEIEKTKKRAIRDAKIADGDRIDDEEDARDEEMREEKVHQGELRQERKAAFRERQDDIKDNLKEQLRDIDRNEAKRAAQIRRAKAKELAILKEGLDEQRKMWEEFVKAFVRAGGKLSELTGGKGGSRKENSRNFATSAYLGLNR